MPLALFDSCFVFVDRLQRLEESVSGTDTFSQEPSDSLTRVRLRVHSSKPVNSDCGTS